VPLEKNKSKVIQRMRNVCYVSPFRAFVELGRGWMLFGASRTG